GTALLESLAPTRRTPPLRQPARWARVDAAHGGRARNIARAGTAASWTARRRRVREHRRASGREGGRERAERPPLGPTRRSPPAALRDRALCGRVALGTRADQLLGRPAWDARGAGEGQLRPHR